MPCNLQDIKETNNLDKSQQQHCRRGTTIQTRLNGEAYSSGSSISSRRSSSNSTRGTNSSFESLLSPSSSASSSYSASSRTDCPAPPSSSDPPPTPQHVANRFQVLCYDQVKRLDDVMKGTIPVHGKGNFPTLEIHLNDLIKVVSRRLRQEGLEPADIRLNGGAASYILGVENYAEIDYRDVDVIFGMPKLRNQTDLQKIKYAVLDSLHHFLPKDKDNPAVSRDNRLNAFGMKDAYVSKLAKVWTPTDRWSLVSLTNNKGRNVELKFVDFIKRQYEFSVDSFQIILDSLLTFYDINTGESKTIITEHFYPTVVAESVYGDFEEAFFHLSKKLIATHKPEEIRGGGLLKYCHLLVKGYSAADDVDIELLEKYMCSRFFIDFSDLPSQQRKLENYLTSHLDSENDEIKYRYLMTLFRVVDDSTVCLMNTERGQILNAIKSLAYQTRSNIDNSCNAYNCSSCLPRCNQMTTQPPHFLSSPCMCQSSLGPQYSECYMPMSTSQPIFVMVDNWQHYECCVLDTSDRNDLTVEEIYIPSPSATNPTHSIGCCSYNFTSSPVEQQQQQSLGHSLPKPHQEYHQDSPRFLHTSCCYPQQHSTVSPIGIISSPSPPQPVQSPYDSCYEFGENSSTTSCSSSSLSCSYYNQHTNDFYDSAYNSCETLCSSPPLSETSMNGAPRCGGGGGGRPKSLIVESTAVTARSRDYCRGRGVPYWTSTSPSPPVLASSTSTTDQSPAAAAPIPNYYHHHTGREITICT